MYDCRLLCTWLRNFSSWFCSIFLHDASQMRLLFFGNYSERFLLGEKFHVIEFIALLLNDADVVIRQQYNAPSSNLYFTLQI